jgi:hypothetical protein
VFSGGLCTSQLPTSLAYCFFSSAPGIVSAQREVLRFAGMGVVLKSPRTVLVLMVSYTQKTKDFGR